MNQFKFAVLLTLIALSMPNLRASNLEANEDATIYYSLTSIQGVSELKVVSPPSGKYKGHITIPNEGSYTNPQSGQTFILPVVEIGESAFSECTDLTGIDLPSSLIQVSKNAFYGCSLLKFVELPSSVTTIGDNAFYGCTLLEKIEMPSALTSIGANAFFNCSSLKELEIPSSLKELGTLSLCKCIGLEKVVLHEGLTKIAANAFQNCWNLKSIEIPNTVTTIGANAFQFCNSLETIEVPNSVTSIDKYAFASCDNLVSVKFPQNNQFNKVPYCCFYYSSPKLETVILPSNITSVEDYAFYGCTALKYIFCESNSLSKETHSFDDVPGTCTLIVPENFSTAISFPKVYGKGAFLFDSTTDINLSDNTYFYNYIGDDSKSVNVTYERTFQAGYCLPLFLPFSMRVSDLKNSLGDDCIIAQLSSIQSVGNGLAINWSSVTSESLNANTPYIVKVTSDKESITALNATFARDRETRDGTFESGAWKVSLHGTLLPETIVANDGKFVLTTYNGGEFRQAGSELTLKPYRFYLTIDARPASSSPNSIKMNIDGEESQDALESILTTEDENGDYYDLQGRKIVNPSNGIFIKNGKKVAL